MSKSIKSDILWRVALVYLSVILFALFIILKVFYLQVIDNERWLAKAENTRIKNFRITPNRGDIYATDMRLLASSVPYYEVRMDMRTPALTDQLFYNKVDSLAMCLSRLFGDRSEATYRSQLVKARREGDRYFLIKNRVDYVHLKKLKTFPILRNGQYKGGLIVNQENIRQKPYKNLAARTIGFTTKDMTSYKVGIEGAYDRYLGGIEGVKRMQKLAGNVWMPLDEAGEIEPKDGSSVVTTIDIDLQDVAEKALFRQLVAQNAHAGTVVLMEVKTGEVRAIVNLTDTLGSYREYYNYAVGQSSEPGSTFKLPAFIAALEDGYISLQDTIDTEKGVYKFYDLTIRDDNYDKGGHGIITAEEVFELSSNIGMAKIITSAYKSNPQRFVDRLYGMNLNEPLGISIKGEGKPLIRYPGDKMWSGASLASMSYGYEVKITPLQILAFYNAIANDGKMVRPRFAKEIRNNGKLEWTFSTEVIDPSICSRSTLKIAQQILEGVVEKGTATNLKNERFRIAGKTGTTQMYSRKTGYKEKSYQASFVGYFPADHPKYSCIVVIYSPRNFVYHGAHVAGPVFYEIASKVYATDLAMHKPVNDGAHRNIEIPFSKSGYQPEISTVLDELDIKKLCKDSHADWVLTERTEEKIVLQPRRVIDNLVPNVISMGLKDAVYLLENAGLKVTVVGRGSVKSQSIPPGTRVKKGERIKLEMSFTEG